MVSLATWSSVLIALIPAILGSGAVFTTIGSYFTEVRDDPIVTLSLIPGNGRGSVEIFNTGGGPATNLSAIITVPYNLKTVHLFSLEKSSFTNESKIINVTIPRLTQGQGALANISFAMSGPQNYSENYDGFALYDQGSTRGSIKSPFDHPIFSPLMNLGGWLINTPIGVGILATIISLSVYFFYLWVRRWNTASIYSEETEEASNALARAYRDYAMMNLQVAKGQETRGSIKVPIQQVAISLMKLEAIALKYQNLVAMLQNRNPKVGNETKVKKHHEIHFNSILEFEIDKFKTDEDREAFLNDLQKEITKVWITEIYYYKAEAFSNLTDRLSTFRKGLEPVKKEEEAAPVKKEEEAAPVKKENGAPFKHGRS